MNYKYAAMDHRWGKRIPLHLMVEISVAGGPPVEGYLLNLSASGALLWTSEKIAIHTPIAVRPLGSDDGFEGRVVRRDWATLGVEWRDPDAHAICLLLALSGPLKEPGDLPTSRRRDPAEVAYPLA